MASDKSFQRFLKQRNTASDAWVSGDFEPLSALLPRKGDATFFGPMGGALAGAAKIAARYEQDASHFAPGSTNKIELLQAASSGDLGFAVFHQRTKAKLAGQPKKVPMTLRVTEIFRRDRGEWKLIHRHADTLAKPQPPK